jgi:predicted RNA-binding Zn-ribbon protein involved in translation (DUF1610 family)
LSASRPVITLAMKQSTCPKCGGKDIRAKEGRDPQSTIPVSPFRSAGLNYRVCVSCGFVETYITDPKHLKRIADKWKPLG